MPSRSALLARAGFVFTIFVSLCSAWGQANAGTKYVEGTARNTVGSPSFGPIGPSCDATTGGSGCLFLTLTFAGQGREAPGGKVTISGTSTALFDFTPSGAHDASGNSTGLCAPFFVTFTTTFRDGSTIDLSGSGTLCCAVSSCPSGGHLGPPSVSHVSALITGGTGRFAGVQGTSEITGSDNGSGTSFDVSEGVRITP